MITDEEKNEIVEKVAAIVEERMLNMTVERLLLSIPETVGNMMANHVVMKKINEKFYSDHPEFNDKRDVVTSVIEMVEGKNPLLDHKEILKKAVPEIRKRLSTMKGLDMEKVSSKPNLTFEQLNAPSDQHGKI